ncbi:hypothetical protein NC653_022532 [Populus alba x Populus x berolinensis]|uniref:Uncharacterized protein n=1 Tax=Populus alba x Populus x berolinensis TaxID=444605 RepID=A0AAD6Q9K3_9ROSI|nr:hypothetical protein NC653_022532 [Populus alba x Populus x berolinensis]
MSRKWLQELIRNNSSSSPIFQVQISVPFINNPFELLQSSSELFKRSLNDRIFFPRWFRFLADILLVRRMAR